MKTLVSGFIDMYFDTASRIHEDAQIVHDSLDPAYGPGKYFTMDSSSWTDIVDFDTDACLKDTALFAPESPQAIVSSRIKKTAK